MPSLSKELRDDLSRRLQAFLEGRGDAGSLQFLGSGGSAATFKAATPDGARAFKVYDPRFLIGPSAAAEHRRLDLQRQLIGHDCPALVKTFSVDTVGDTAIIEMEFVQWPGLKALLGSVPDDKISQLIRQLVSAVRFLESLGIVHRDIKPENIHVSEDFECLKLIDLGVARGVEARDEEGTDATDHGNRRPFIATAQYSSPEYLFRLEAPSAELWGALSIYQVGAVLHDLINGRAIFQDEVDLDNKWLVAKAVLTKTPDFRDSNPSRLSALKALSLRCLAKDPAVRKQVVSWSDFETEGSSDPLAILRQRLDRDQGAAGAQSARALARRLDFERSSYARGFFDAIRTELIVACHRKLQVGSSIRDAEPIRECVFEVSMHSGPRVLASVVLQWDGGLRARFARIEAAIALDVDGEDLEFPPLRPLGEIGIDEAPETWVLELSRILAAAVSNSLDLLEASPDPASLGGTDLLRLIQRAG